MMKATAMLFANNKCLVSREFDGSLYLERGSSGQRLLNYLEKVKSEQDFVQSILNFNEELFGHQYLLFYEVRQLRKIIFSRQTYFFHWFSDFLFFLNIGRSKIRIIDMDRKRIDLCPHEIIVFYLGRFYLLTHNDKPYAAKPIQQLSIA